MEPQVSDPWLNGVVLLLAMFSIAIWFALVPRLLKGPLLAPAPRRPVPWSGVWITLPLLLVAAALYGAYGDGADDAPQSAAEAIERVLSASSMTVLMVAVFLTVVALSSGARRDDLGLPASWSEFARLARIGIVAWLAALVPVYFVELLIFSLLGKSEGHPLIEMLTKNATPTLFAAVFFAAVIVAPICEEVLFRLLLQGWLEKWEDRRLGWRTPALPIDMQPAIANGVETAGVSTPTEPPVVEPMPPRIGLGGLPYGSLPILISSLLFAIAHAGTGTDPIPLFVLATILGYIYQRTHSIVPSIVTHAMFNGMSLFMLGV